jgi:hypothetical protein
MLGKRDCIGMYPAFCLLLISAVQLLRAFCNFKKLNGKKIKKYIRRTMG